MTSVTINPEQWIRVSTAAGLLGITRQGTYYRVKQGNFETICMDKTVFVRKTDISEIKGMLRAKNRELLK